MTRLRIPEPHEAPVGSHAILGDVAGSLGVVPNVVRLLSLGPNALTGFVGLQGALGRTLTARTRDHIALAVSEVNGCRYCLSAHSHFAARFAKLSPDDVARARKGGSSDAKEDAAVRFAKKVVELRGKVSPEDLADVRAAGYPDAQIVEIVALCAQFSMTNLINNVFDTEIDFPAVEAPRAAGMPGSAAGAT